MKIGRDKEGHRVPAPRRKGEELSGAPSVPGEGRGILEMFDAIASRYDRVNTLMTFGFDRAWRRRVVRRSGLRPGGRALDICCGTGMLVLELASVAGPRGEVVGLDASREMLAVADKNMRDFRWKEAIRLIHGDALRLPFREGVFDCVTIAWGLRNVSSIPLALEGMARSVRPGGKVVSLDMSHPTGPLLQRFYWLYLRCGVPLLGSLGAGQGRIYRYLHDSSLAFPSPSSLAHLFRQAGLTEVKWEGVMGGALAIVEGRRPADLGNPPTEKGIHP